MVNDKSHEAFEKWFFKKRKAWKEIGVVLDEADANSMREGYEASRADILSFLNSDEAVEVVALKIHQCHYHPVDWGSKEQLAMFEHEKPLAIAKAKAAIEAIVKEIEK